MLIVQAANRGSWCLTKLAVKGVETAWQAEMHNKDKHSRRGMQAALPHPPSIARSPKRQCIDLQHNEPHYLLRCFLSWHQEEKKRMVFTPMPPYLTYSGTPLISSMTFTVFLNNATNENLLNHIKIIHDFWSTYCIIKVKILYSKFLIVKVDAH